MIDLCNQQESILAFVETGNQCVSDGVMVPHSHLGSSGNGQIVGKAPKEKRTCHKPGFWIVIQCNSPCCNQT